MKQVYAIFLNLLAIDAVSWTEFPCARIICQTIRNETEPVSATQLVQKEEYTIPGQRIHLKNPEHIPWPFRNGT